MGWRTRLLIGLSIVYTGLGHQYARVWASDLTLWTHARQHAPFKLRPYLNQTKAAWLAQP